MHTALEKPGEFRRTWSMICLVARFAPGLMRRRGGFFTGLPEADKTVSMEHPELSRALFAAMAESVREGTRGPQWDAALAVSPWDFPIESIPMTVHLWQGEDDRNVSPAAGHFFARTIPGCQAVFLPGEGHISLVVNHLEEILRVLSGQ